MKGKMRGKGKTGREGGWKGSKEDMGGEGKGEKGKGRERGGEWERRRKEKQSKDKAQWGVMLGTGQARGGNGRRIRSPAVYKRVQRNFPNDQTPEIVHRQPPPHRNRVRGLRGKDSKLQP